MCSFWDEMDLKCVVRASVKVAASAGELRSSPEALKPVNVGGIRDREHRRIDITKNFDYEGSIVN